jgi:hypothetical protein
VEVEVVVLAAVDVDVVVAVAPFSPAISPLAPSAFPGVYPLSPGASPGVPAASARAYPPWYLHLLHHPHLSCNGWVNSDWWRRWRIHLCWLWLGLSKYPSSVSIGR